MWRGGAFSFSSFLSYMIFEVMIVGLSGPKPKLNKWGGYCPEGFSFNSYWKKTGRCEDWRHHLFNTWYSHGERGFIKGTNTWCDFSNFYEWCLKQSWIDQFKANHIEYDFDKDLIGDKLGIKEFSIRTVQLVHHSINEKYATSRGVIGKRVSDGFVKEFESLTEAGVYIGTEASQVSACCRGVQKTCHGWTFTYK